VVLGVAGGFLLVAIVFGALAYFQTVPTPGGSTNISVPVTTAVTVTPSAASSPAGGETGPPGPTRPAVVTITATRVVSVPQASAGSNLGAIESGASTLSAVVAAGAAVIGLRPRGRDRSQAPPATADAADPVNPALLRGSLLQGSLLQGRGVGDDLGPERAAGLLVVVDAEHS
jgi:hypothetical protein